MGLLQDLFRTHGPAYLERFGSAMPTAHKKVIAAITDCHTEAAGSALFPCWQQGQCRLPQERLTTCRWPQPSHT